MARISGKLTVKALGWDQATIGESLKGLPANGRIHVARIVGIASAIRLTFDDKRGEAQTGLKGQFRGISSRNELLPKKDKNGKVETDKDGKILTVDSGKPIVVTAGVCYLPSGLQDMVEGALAKAQEIDAKATVQFGLDLYVKPDTNLAGYTYDAETFVQATETDPLEALLSVAPEQEMIEGTVAEVKEAAE